MARFSKTFDDILSDVQKIDRDIEKLRQLSDEVKVKQQQQINLKIDRVPVVKCVDCGDHYLTYCNLCQEMTSCDECGCYNCQLKAQENEGALDMISDDDRETLRIVSERVTNSRRKQSAKRRKKTRKFANKKNYREAYLDDILASR